MGHPTTLSFQLGTLYFPVSHLHACVCACLALPLALAPGGGQQPSSSVPSLPCSLSFVHFILLSLASRTAPYTVGGHTRSLLTQFDLSTLLATFGSCCSVVAPELPPSRLQVSRERKCTTTLVVGCASWASYLGCPPPDCPNGLWECYSMWPSQLPCL